MFHEDSKVWNQSDQDGKVTEPERWKKTDSLSRLGARGVAPCTGHQASVSSENRELGGGPRTGHTDTVIPSGERDRVGNCPRTGLCGRHKNSSSKHILVSH